MPKSDIYDVRWKLMMYWDYRVFFEDGGYTIRTVYYDDKGAIAACSEKETIWLAIANSERKFVKFKRLTKNRCLFR